MSDWWRGRPWRMIQTNLRQIDMRDINARQVVRDLQSFEANLLMLNAAGIIASYPTNLPFHHQSPHLGGDSLADIIAACHEAEIRVIARTDFSKVRRPIYEQHPQWAYRTAEGQIVDYNGDVHVCLNSDYQQHYALRILEELFSTLPFDGVFFNMGGYQTRDYSGNYYGPCHCESCRAKFQRMYGQAIPRREDMHDGAYRQYVRFKHQTRREHEQRVYEFLSQRWPHLCIANHTHAGRGFIRQESNTALDRPLPRWAYSASENTRWAVASHPDMVSSNTTVDFLDFPARHVAVSPAQQAMRLAQSLANGGAPDYYLIGRLDNHADRSGFAPVRDIFRFHARHQQRYQNLRPEGEIALVRGPHMNVREFRGWFRLLVEHHFLFATPVVHGPEDLDWSRYRALILPDQQALGEALAERIDQYLRGGGTVIASGCTGWRDQHFEPREAPALAGLGVRRPWLVREDMRSAYIEVHDKRRFPSLAQIDLLHLGDRYVVNEYAEEAERALGMIPPQPFGPPERCYSEWHSDHPGYVVHRHGAGRCVYVPWWPGTLFYEQGYPNTFRFAGDLLSQVAELESVAGNLPPMVEVTVLRQSSTGQRLVHLVNGSGHFGNTFHEPPALRDLWVRIGCDAQPGEVRQLRADKPCDHQWQSGQLTLQVETLEDFEAVCISP